MSLSLYLSLFICMYIYIYIYTYETTPPRCPCRVAIQPLSGECVYIYIYYHDIHYSLRIRTFSPMSSSSEADWKSHPIPIIYRPRTSNQNGRT